MRQWTLCWLAVVMLLPGRAVPVTAGARSDEPRAPVSTPLLFVENVGQFAPAARFQARLGAATLWLADDALWLTIIGSGCALPDAPCPANAPGPMPSASARAATGRARAAGAHLKLSFVGANPRPALEPADRRTPRVSYLRGREPARWQVNVPVWGRVRYRDLYPGIDLVVSGDAQGWLPVLEARPGADLQAVALRVQGAAALTLEGRAVRVDTAAGAYRLPLLAWSGAPFARAAGTAPAVAEDTVRAPFAATRTAAPAEAVAAAGPLTGTHDLVFSTFLGGSGQDASPAMAVDAAGAAYVTGESASADFPTTPGAFDPTWNGGYRDAVVAKLSPDGSTLVYATYLGGTRPERGYDIAVDAAGAAYVVGETQSPDFPLTPGAFSSSLQTYTVFVTKLAPDGAALAYSTFLGVGCDPDHAYRCGIALDGAGQAYVVGVTWDPDFPVTPGAFQTACQCAEHVQGFVTKFNATGSALVYSTFLGGGYGPDWVLRVVVDAAGAAYVSGITRAFDFPTTPGAWDPTYNGGAEVGDAFVSKLAPDGSALAYSTFLGGSQDECVYQDCALALDGSGAVYVTGNTQSSDFPTTPGAYDRTFQGGGYANTDAFVSQLAPDGSALVYSTFLGGACEEGSTGIQVDAAGRAVLGGYTCSADFPTTPDAYDPLYHFGFGAAFVTVLNASGSALDYSTFLGGSGLSNGFDLALDAAGAARLVGVTDSADFPTTPGAFDPLYHGGYDFFVAKLAPHMRPQLFLPVTATGP